MSWYNKIILAVGLLVLLSTSACLASQDVRHLVTFKSIVNQITFDISLDAENHLHADIVGCRVLDQARADGCVITSLTTKQIADAPMVLEELERGVDSGYDPYGDDDRYGHQNAPCSILEVPVKGSNKDWPLQTCDWRDTLIHDMGYSKLLECLEPLMKRVRAEALIKLYVGGIGAELFWTVEYAEVVYDWFGFIRICESYMPEHQDITGAIPGLQTAIRRDIVPSQTPETRIDPEASAVNLTAPQNTLRMVHINAS